MASEQAIRQMNHLRSQGRAEMVVYHSTDGLSREIVCLVDRPGPEPHMGGLAPLMAVTALNDERHGIASGLLDTGTDRLVMTDRIGDKKPVSRGVQRVKHHDADFITLEVQ